MIWHNGKFKKDGPLFAANDRAFRGHGVFDTILAVNSRPVYVREHLKRLADHAKVIGIKLPHTITEKTLIDLLKKNKMQNAIISILVTGGPAERGLQHPKNPKPQIIIRALKYSSKNAPIHAVIAKNTRRNEGSPLSQIKSLNYGDNILAGEGAILLNNKDRMTCFTTGNLFVLKNGKLFTPPLKDGVMNGIIRQKWMKQAKITEKSLTVADLTKADAIFLTNSMRGIVPVATLDGKKLKPVDFTFDRHIHHG